MNRKMIARELLGLAKEIMGLSGSQIKMVFEREDGKDKELNNIHFELQRFVSTVRSNEELKTSVSRVDDENKMTLTIGLSEHEEIEAIMKAIRKQAKKLAKKAEVKVELGVGVEEDE